MKAAALAFLLLLAAPAAAQTTDRIEVETDPLTYFNQGYSAQAAIKPASIPRLRAQVSTFAQDLPSFAMAKPGWNIRIGGATAGADVYLSPGRTGLFAGVMGSYVESTLTRDDSPGVSRRVTLAGAMPRIGYQWFPFGRGVYLTPWVGVNLAAKIWGTAELGGHSYPKPSVFPQAAVHLGFRF